MQLWLAQGELAHAARWADELLQNGGSSAAIGREREKVALIRLLLAQNRPTEVRTRLAPLVERATQQKHWGLVIELRLLQAQAQSLLHEEQEALAHLWQAVRLAETEGYVRLFVDEGPLLETLLGRLRERERRRGPTPYMDTLLAAFPPREQAEQPPVSARKPGWLHVGYKGSKWRDIDLLNEACAPLYAYLQATRDIRRTYVFMSQRSERLTEEGIHYWFRTLKVQATTDQWASIQDLTFHDLRQDFAYRAREAGWSPEEVAYYLGLVTKKGAPAIQAH
jgi:hypothetical protein